MGVHTMAMIPGIPGERRAARTPPPRRGPRWATAALALGAVASGLMPTACGKSVDPDAPYQMRLNGNPYLPGVGRPIATVADIEVGFSNASQCTVIFPLNALKNHPRPGLEIIFDPARVPIGEEVSLGPEGNDGGVQLAYYPFFGGMSNDGRMMVYSIGDEGWARLRFDGFDAEARRVQGVLLEAVFYGCYVDQDGQPSQPKKRQEMRLANFAFDAELTDGLW